MIEPVLSDDALLKDIAAARAETDGGERFCMWWLGQSGYLIQFRGMHLLIDPYISESLTKKYAGTDKPHVRMTRCPIAPERLDFVDVVTSSHNHTDHLDAESLKPLLQANPKIKLIAPEANRAFVAERLGIERSGPVGMDDGKRIDISIQTASKQISMLRVSGIASAHEKLEKDEHGRDKFLGYIFQFGKWSIYHSGDTVKYTGIYDRLRRFKIDLALLPINGALPERRVAGNLSGIEAARLAKDIGAGCVIPCHYEMFEFNTADPNDEFIPECKSLAQPYRVLRCGERFSSTEIAG